MRTLSFTLPFALSSGNVLLRTHWAKRRRMQQNVALQVIVALGGTRHIPRPPLGRVRLIVTRHSQRMLDVDNLASSVKHLADVLCPPSARHPCGLGIITDDAPSLCHLVVEQILTPQVAHRRTEVAITEIGDNEVGL